MFASITNIFQRHTSETSEEPPPTNSLSILCEKTGTNLPTAEKEVCDTRSPENTVEIESEKIFKNLSFCNLHNARTSIQEFAGCPVQQNSTQNKKYINFKCFRAGTLNKKSIQTTIDKKRNKNSSKCGCGFHVKLKASVNESYIVYSVNKVHNHELFSEEELSLLTQNRFIPDNVKLRILALNDFGVLNPAQIMRLIEGEFPETRVTWTKRDVQNLLQANTKRTHEANDLVQLLEDKQAKHGWKVSFKLDSISLRLERLFWMSHTSKANYLRFADVIEGDATYKSNRFGLPLVLFCGIDNNGLTFLIAGALISDETFSSYQWRYGVERAINKVWPTSVHLLCRFHIAQNISKKLAGILRGEFSKFLEEFWRIASIEDENEFNTEFETLKCTWQTAANYLGFLDTKKSKWAFSYTHAHFVAGIASTQRQESVNNQVKLELINNSNLSRVVDGFEKFEERFTVKMVHASLKNKLAQPSADPIINDALKHLTNYAGCLLNEESVLSLSYICEELNPALFKVSHKDHPHMHRLVECISEKHINCSCRKATWHGIVCRHILSVLRRSNRLQCPISWFNPRWTKAFCSPSNIDLALGGVKYSVNEDESIENVEQIDEQISLLTALSKDIIQRCVGNNVTYELAKATLQSLQANVKLNQKAMQSIEQGNTPDVRNPLKVQTKGRPKTGTKRYRSIAEDQRRGKKSVVKCGRCGDLGHNVRTCNQQENSSQW